MYKQINTQAGNNIADPQPIKTYSKMFESLKPPLKFDISLLIVLIDLVVLIISIGFPVDIVRNRQVWSCLKKGQICNVVVFIVNFFCLLECPMFFQNLPVMVAGWTNLKSVSKICETHSLRGQLLPLSKSLHLAAVHQKPIKIQQIQSKLIKLKLLDEIFDEIAKKSVSLKLNVYWVN